MTLFLGMSLAFLLGMVGTLVMLYWTVKRNWEFLMGALIGYSCGRYGPEDTIDACAAAIDGAMKAGHGSDS